MQRFYGAADWWHLPLRLLRSYVAMLPRLQAETALQHVAELQAADSWLDGAPRRATISAWQRAARPPDARPRRVSKEEFLAQMSALGFGIEA